MKIELFSFSHWIDFSRLKVNMEKNNSKARGGDSQLNWVQRKMQIFKKRKPTKAELITESKNAGKLINIERRLTSTSKTCLWLMKDWCLIWWFIKRRQIQYCITLDYKYNDLDLVLKQEENYFDVGHVRYWDAFNIE